MERLHGRIGVGTDVVLVLAALLNTGVLLKSGTLPGVAGEWTSWDP